MVKEKDNERLSRIDELVEQLQWWGNRFSRTREDAEACEERTKARLVGYMIEDGLMTEEMSADE